MNALNSQGFLVIDGPFDAVGIEAVSREYDEVLASLPETGIKRGSRSLRFGGLANGPWFCPIFLHPPLLAIAAPYFDGSFKLSSFHGRTLLPCTTTPPLHQDVEPGSDGDPILGFIYMLDPFTAENGATRFAQGSRHLACLPEDTSESVACGAAGSLLIFDGATWHEHGANQTRFPRRSIQGAFIRRDHTAAVRWADELHEDYARQLSPLARTLLCL